MLTSGGVSMGELDLIKADSRGAGHCPFWSDFDETGKPLTFATIRPEVVGGGSSKLVFGLPSNPVSSLVTFYLFVVPALRKVGWPVNHLQRVRRNWHSRLRLIRHAPNIIAPRYSGMPPSIRATAAIWPGAPVAKLAAVY
ncbi:MAG: hypothetical protein R2867_09585 [Caldilineaceae bacterium]